MSTEVASRIGRAPRSLHDKRKKGRGRERREEGEVGGGGREKNTNGKT